MLTSLFCKKNWKKSECRICCDIGLLHIYIAYFIIWGLYCCIKRAWGFHWSICSPLSIDRGLNFTRAGRHPYLAGAVVKFFSVSTLFFYPFQELFDIKLLKKNVLELKNTSQTRIWKIIEKNNKQFFFKFSEIFWRKKLFIFNYYLHVYLTNKKK